MKKSIIFVSLVFFFFVVFSESSLAAGPVFINRQYYEDGTYSIIHNVELTSDTTWTKDSSPYVIEGWVHVMNGATLTIEPGAVVKFGEHSYAKQGTIIVDSGCKLVADGESDQEILFTSFYESPNPGDWASLEILPGGSADIDYAIFEYAGNWDNGAITINSSDISVTNCVIRKSSSDGIFLKGEINPTIKNISFSEINGYAICQDSVNADPILASLSTDNPNKGIRIPYNNTGITKNIIWENASIPYILADWVRIEENGVLNIEPNNIVKFNPLGSALQGNIQVKAKGALYVNGVTFTSNKTSTPEDPIGPGEWAHIYGAKDSTVRILNSTLTYGGQWDKGSIWLETSDALIENTTISSGASHGVFLNATGTTPTFRNVTIQNNTKYGIYLYYCANPTYENITQSGNNKDGVFFRDESIAGAVNWGEDEGPYHLAGWYNVTENSSLEIKPGAKVYFYPIGYAKQSNIKVSPGSTLKAIGTVATPIFFTSSKDKKNAGDWANVAILSGASGWFANCCFEYGGQWNEGELNISSSNVKIENCTFANTASSAINIASNAGPSIISGNQFNIDKAQYGINNRTPATTVNAINNWWGHSSGPYNQKANPDGQGVKVSDGVNFVPYYTNPLGSDEDDYTLWTPTQSTVDKDKVWNIEFNKALNHTFVTSNYFYVLDRNGVIVPTRPSLSNDRKTVLIELINSYEPSEKYTLYIKKGVKSLDGSELAKSIKMNFDIFMIL